MTTYKAAGVDISEGDKASAIAYEKAIATFAGRKGMIGEPTELKEGFAGVLDFGDHYLVMGCDTVGTKINIAIDANNFVGLGNDLIAMVADDMVCIGAETVAITNTIDTKKVDLKQISKMMESLSKICIAQKIVIPGGEIAESGDSVAHTIWDASGTGVVEKEKYIMGEKIQPGDKIITLRETGFRCNGFSLVRHICKSKKISYVDDFDNGQTWGEILLTPSIVYHDAVLSLVGRFGEKPQIDVHGIAHITGGGIIGNLSRILKKRKLGAELSSIWKPPEIILRLQELGAVEDEEAYKTWSMGNGMMIIVSEKEAEKSIELLSKKGIEARIAGKVQEDRRITIKNKGAFQKQKTIEATIK